MIEKTTSYELGVHTCGFIWNWQAIEAVQELIEAGINRFSLCAQPPHVDVRRITEDQKTELRNAVTNANGEISALDFPSIDINLCSANPDAVRYSIEQHLMLINTAADLQCRWAATLPGRRHGLLPPPDDRLHDVMRRSFDQLSLEASRKGVRLLVENHPLSLLPKGSDIASFIRQQRYDNIDIVYDITNALFIDEDPDEGLRSCSDYLVAVHLSDTPAGQWRHDRVGTGSVDFDSVLKTLCEINFSGQAILEIISTNALPEILESRAFLSERGWNFR